MTVNSVCLIIPKYIQSLKGSIADYERQRFLIRLAAVYATEDGTIEALRIALGLGKNGLARFTRESGIPRPMDPELAIKIEKLVGRDVIQREELAPHIYKQA